MLEDKSRLGARYATAMAAVFFLPGILLTIFDRFQPIFLPRAVIDYLFPIALPPIERQLIVTLFNGPTLVEPAAFDSIGIFARQIFVVALFCFVLIILLYWMKARAGALIAPPTAASTPVLVVVIVMSLYARWSFSQFFIVGVGNSQPGMPTLTIAKQSLDMLAPEALILFTCLIAISFAQIGLFVARMSRRLFAPT
jgi:hypothetical protein